MGELEVKIEAKKLLVTIEDAMAETDCDKHDKCSDCPVYRMCGLRIRLEDYILNHKET